LALRFLALPVLTTKRRQTTHHSITDITAAVVLAAADITDMDKAECSISPILPVRHPQCRDNNNYAFDASRSGAASPDMKLGAAFFKRRERR
jgi:hypothetical protein